MVVVKTKEFSKVYITEIKNCDFDLDYKNKNFFRNTIDKYSVNLMKLIIKILCDSKLRRV